mgnify:CR=1 FL=1
MAENVNVSVNVNELYSVLREKIKAIHSEQDLKKVDKAFEIGVENGFIQEGETAEDSFIPVFDGEGWK